MINNFISIIKRFTGASNAYEIEVIQSLWSGYGKIVRYGLENCSSKSVVIKHVQLAKSKKNSHLTSNDLSHLRKLKSYKVETAWYRNWSNLCDSSCYVPKCFGIEVQGDEVIIVLEDLSDIGFDSIKKNISYDEMKLVISWMANFHAKFIRKSADDLWKVGTYWHLDTRPHELSVLGDIELKKFAFKIDEELKRTPYKTLVHGDAKLANFCFSKDGRSVAGVDFQYVGAGCGMKDLAYFVGSCLDDDECEIMEKTILDDYFIMLKKAFACRSMLDSINLQELEENWRYLYPFAWADFHRFLKGWSPQHWKRNCYSEKTTQYVINKLKEK